MKEQAEYEQCLETELGDLKRFFKENKMQSSNAFIKDNAKNWSSKGEIFKQMVKYVKETMLE